MCFDPSQRGRGSVATARVSLLSRRETESRGAGDRFNFYSTGILALQSISGRFDGRSTAYRASHTSGGTTRYLHSRLIDERRRWATSAKDEPLLTQSRYDSAEGLAAWQRLLHRSRARMTARVPRIEHHTRQVVPSGAYAVG